VSGVSSISLKRFCTFENREEYFSAERIRKSGKAIFMWSLLLEGFSMNRHGLRSDQFARIKKLLPGRPGGAGRDSQLGNRLFVEAVIWKFRTGVPWADMSVRFGAWKNIHLGRWRFSP
jgi:hypothetical protein